MVQPPLLDPTTGARGSAQALATAFPGPTGWSRLPVVELPEPDELGPIPGALARLSELTPGEGKAGLVMDENVARLYGAAAEKALAGRLISAHELAAGEEAKSFASFQRLLEELPFLGLFGTKQADALAPGGFRS